MPTKQFPQVFSLARAQPAEQKGKLWRGLCLGVIFAGGLLAAGCADTTTPSTRILFNDASINGVPMRLALDTGSGDMTVFEDSAKHAGMEIFLRSPPTVDDRFLTVTNALAKPARFNLGGGETTVQPLVGNLSKYSIMVAADNARIDGFISWPEVKDNILVFDGPEHKISSVETLPASVNKSWATFSIGKSDQLTLRTKLANGRVGTILVDTGAYFGIALPPAQWQEWRAAHPSAPSGFLIYLTPGVIGRQSAEEAWADEFQLGGLTFIDVPVHPANPSEMNNVGSSYIGTIGLYALARLEFVVDGKHGVVYARPRIGPGPYYPSISRPGIVKDADGGPLGQDWKIDGKVSLNATHMRQLAGGVLLREANAKYQNGDHAGALAECTQAIEYDDQNDAAFMVRGSLRLVDGDVTGGMADLNHAIELNPENIWAYTARATYKYSIHDLAGAVADYSSAIDNDPNYAAAYFERGAVKQILNDTPGAIADYDQVCQLQPNNPRALLYREVLQRWSGRPPRDFSRITSGWNDPWEQAVGNYLSGHLSEDALMMAAGSTNNSAANLCEAYYFTGFTHFIAQDTAGARERWQKCVGTNQTKMYDYAFAQTLLKFVDSLGK